MCFFFLFFIFLAYHLSGLWSIALVHYTSWLLPILADTGCNKPGEVGKGAISYL